MNIFRNTGLILSLAFAAALPLSAAAEVPVNAAPAPAAAQPEVQSMQDLMREMRRDPSKCKNLQGAAADANTPAPMPGMGIGMMGMGPGMGLGMGPGMNGKNCKPGSGMQGQDKPCMQGQHPNCYMRGGADDQRLDMLEKRMDMMQMMMEMMLRSGRN
jgi:hypothetical protein